jgi:hypothetical protein
MNLSRDVIVNFLKKHTSSVDENYIAAYCNELAAVLSSMSYLYCIM